MRLPRCVLAVLTVVLAGALLSPAGQAAASPTALTTRATRTIPPIPSSEDVDYQLGGGYRPAANVGIVERDSTEAPAAGLYNVCYLNGFQTQPGDRAFWRAHPRLVLHRHGRPVADPGWPDEWLLDISTAAKRKKLARIVGRWITGCARSGYQAVEFDNFDSFTRSHRLLKARHANAFARTLVRISHRAGLAAGQKNRAAFNGRRLGFDFAVAESCARWSECDSYLAHYGDQVLAIEYRRSDFRAACAQVGARIPVVYADRELSPHGPRDWC